MIRLAGSLAALAILFAGCTAQPAGTDTPADINVWPSAEASRTPAEGRTVLASDLDVPWDMAVLPDGSVLVTLRDAAEVVRVADGGTTRVAGVTGVAPAGEGGLLGIALSPHFGEDGLLYLYLTSADDNRVVRYRYDGDELTAPTPILTGIPKAANHNGGRIRFGPDGDLYVGTGDAGRAENAQDLDSLGGKILRVTPDGDVPADNPFASAVYSYGHRNVQGLGWDVSGQLYASEFGQDRYDELNLVRPGGNYGWPQAEGMAGAPGLVDPLLVWAPKDASPSGIAVTAGGTVYIACLRGERVLATTATSDGMTDPEVVLDGLGRVRAVEVVDDRLYVLTNNTARGTPREGDDQLVSLPLR
ncbi:MAG: PQQ-dependent sugar dehydrogenase [Propionicimonas sp.]|uniref:PQQ-dependent sugar dehydrogenase n=1 Tax=Propionicimonas sp. TaxID=1955623 RepID=UPI003D11B77E